MNNSGEYPFRLSKLEYTESDICTDSTPAAVQTYLKLHFEQDGVLSVLLTVLDEVCLLHWFLGNGPDGLVFLGCRRERENVNVS